MKGSIDEFLDLPPHFLEVKSSENHHKHEILAVGRSGCKLSVYVKKLLEGRVLSKILVISQHAMWSRCQK